jgi:hypothetical protein
LELKTKNGGKIDSFFSTKTWPPHTVCIDIRNTDNFDKPDIWSNLSHKTTDALNYNPYNNSSDFFENFWWEFGWEWEKGIVQDASKPL